MYAFYEAEPAAQIAVLQNTQPKVNQQTQTVRYECTKCDSIFTARLYLHHHEAMAHNRIFHCPFCESLFSNKGDFATHVLAHTEKRILHCGFCRKIFYDVDEYTIHTKLHTEPFMYKCDKCSAMFSQLSKLRTHSAIHFNRKFVHTIPKFKKKRRTICQCTDSPADNSSNVAENHGKSQSHQTEAPCVPPRGQEESEPDTAQEPEPGCSRSHESKENSPQKSSSSLRKKRKNKDKKPERHLKRIEAAKESAEICTQTLPSDDIEITPPLIQQLPPTSEHRRVTRQQNKATATDRTTATTHRELSNNYVDATSAAEQQIPSNFALENTARTTRKGASRSRRNNRANEIEKLFEDNIESTAAPVEKISSSTVETRSSEAQQNEAKIRTAKKQVLRRSKRGKIAEKRRGSLRNRNESLQFVRVLRSRLQKYQYAGSVTETEAGGSSKNEIATTSVPEMQTSSLNQGTFSSDDQTAEAGITSATKEQVVSQSKNKEMRKKSDRLLKNKSEPTQLGRSRELRQKRQQAETVTETEVGGSSDSIEITSAPENQISSSSQEIPGSEDQENDAGIRPITRNQILSQSKNEKIGKIPGCAAKKTTGTNTETEADILAEDHFELNPTSVEQIFSVIEGTLTTFEQRRDDVQVNPATKRQPLSSLINQNAPETGQDPKVPEKTSECNTNQILTNESIPLSRQEQIRVQENYSAIIDLTSSPEHTLEATAGGALFRIGDVTSHKRKQLSSLQIFGKVQKSKPSSSNKEPGQKASASSVSVVKNVTGSLTKIQFIQSTQSNAPISRVTVLKPVALSKPAVVLSKTNEVTSSGSQTSTTSHPERMQRKRRPIYETDFSSETTESTDTAAKSTTDKETQIDLENAGSVYTFEEEDLNDKTTTSNAVSSGPSKRRRSESWRFFMTASKSQKKKSKPATHLKRRRSIQFYKCTRCLRLFQDYDSLSKHELIHKENRGVRCTVCGGVFAGVGNLISHQKLTHNSPN